jgi:hypothetical protein
MLAVRTFLAGARSGSYTDAVRSAWNRPGKEWSTFLAGKLHLRREVHMEHTLGGVYVPAEKG